jgi:sugar phosphate isomerase/epimerase
MMKLAFSTLACPAWTWEQILDAAVRYGYDAIEIRGIEDEMVLPHCPPFQSHRLEQTLAQLDRAGLSICALDTSCSFHDPTRFDDSIREGTATIQLAAQLHVPYIRVFGDLIPAREDTESVYHRVAEGLQTLGEYAEQHGVTVLLETHGDFADPQHILAVLERTASSAVGVLWDVLVSYARTREPLRQTYAKLGKHIRHIHLKDGILQGGHPEYCLIGEGDLPVNELIELLQENRYDGCLSLEWEKRWVASLAEPEIALPQFVAYMNNKLRND